MSISVRVTKTDHPDLPRADHLKLT